MAETDNPLYGGWWRWSPLHNEKHNFVGPAATPSESVKDTTLKGSRKISYCLLSPLSSASKFVPGSIIFVIAHLYSAVEISVSDLEDDIQSSGIGKHLPVPGSLLAAP